MDHRDSANSQGREFPFSLAEARGILERLGIGILTLSERGNCEWSNQAGHELLRTEAGGLAGLSLEELFDSGDLARLRGAIGDVLAGRERELRADAWLVRRNGERFPARLALHGPGGGALPGARVLVIEPTGQAEGFRMAFLRQVMNSLPSVVSYLDRDLRYRFINSAYEKWTGYRAEEMMGRTFEDIFGGETVEAVLPYIDRVLSGEVVTYERTLHYRRRGAREVSVTYVPDAEEGARRARGFLVLVQDLSELRDKERLIAEQQEKMISSAKLAALGEMAGGISHEINNPLAIIHAKSVKIRNLAREGLIDPERIATTAERIEQMSLRISLIIKALRNIAREGQDDPFQLTGVAGLLEESSELCRQRFSDYGIAFSVENSCPELSIECRSVQISQVILNLLNNAFDAVVEAPEKRITLAAREMRTDLEISVTDSGHGVPAALRERIFLPFVTTKEVGKGMGLGLSVSKGIVEAHSGFFTLDSGSERTRFVVRLPKRQTGSAPAPGGPRPAD